MMECRMIISLAVAALLAEGMHMTSSASDVSTLQASSTSSISNSSITSQTLPKISKIERTDNIKSNTKSLRSFKRKRSKKSLRSENPSHDWKINLSLTRHETDDLTNKNLASKDVGHLSMKLQIQGNGSLRAYNEYQRALYSASALSESLFGQRDDKSYTYETDAFVNPPIEIVQMEQNKKEFSPGRSGRFLFNVFGIGRPKTTQLPETTTQIHESVSEEISELRSHNAVAKNQSAISYVESTETDHVPSHEGPLNQSRVSFVESIKPDHSALHEGTKNGTVTEEELEKYCLNLMNKEIKPLLNAESNEQSTSFHSKTDQEILEGTFLVPEETSDENVSKQSRFLNLNLFGLGSGRAPSIDETEQSPTFTNETNVKISSFSASVRDCEDYFNLKKDALLKPDMMGIITDFKTELTNMENATTSATVNELQFKNFTGSIKGTNATENIPNQIEAFNANVTFSFLEENTNIDNVISDIMTDPLSSFSELVEIDPKTESSRDGRIFQLDWGSGRTGNPTERQFLEYSEFGASNAVESTQTSKELGDSEMVGIRRNSDESTIISLLKVEFENTTAPQESRIFNLFGLAGSGDGRELTNLVDHAGSTNISQVDIIEFDTSTSQGGRIFNLFEFGGSGDGRGLTEDFHSTESSIDDICDDCLSVINEFQSSTESPGVFESVCEMCSQNLHNESRTLNCDHCNSNCDHDCLLELGDEIESVNCGECNEYNTVCDDCKKIPGHNPTEEETSVASIEKVVGCDACLENTSEIVQIENCDECPLTDIPICDDCLSGLSISDSTTESSTVFKSDCDFCSQNLQNENHTLNCDHCNISNCGHDCLQDLSIEIESINCDNCNEFKSDSNITSDELVGCDDCKDEIAEYVSNETATSIDKQSEYIRLKTTSESVQFEDCNDCFSNLEAIDFESNVNDKNFSFHQHQIKVNVSSVEDQSSDPCQDNCEIFGGQNFNHESIFDISRTEKEDSDSLFNHTHIISDCKECLDIDDKLAKVHNVSLYPINEIENLGIAENASTEAKSQLFKTVLPKDYELTSEIPANVLLEDIEISRDNTFAVSSTNTNDTESRFFGQIFGSGDNTGPIDLIEENTFSSRPVQRRGRLDDSGYIFESEKVPVDGFTTPLEKSEVLSTSVSWVSSKNKEPSSSTELKHTSEIPDFPETIEPRFCLGAYQCNGTLNERCMPYTGSSFACDCGKAFVRHKETKICEPKVHMKAIIKLPAEEFSDDLKDYDSLNYHSKENQAIKTMEMLIGNDPELHRILSVIDVIDFKPGSLIVTFSLELASDRNLGYEELKLKIEGRLKRSLNDPSLRTPLNTSYSTVVQVERDGDPCLENVCSENANCILDKRTTVGYSCRCKDGYFDALLKYGYSGEECQVYCPSDYCRNGGICRLLEDERRQCLCTHWYFGGRCDISVIVAVLAVLIIIIGSTIGMFAIYKNRKNSKGFGTMSSPAAVRAVSDIIALEETGNNAGVERIKYRSTPQEIPTIRVICPTLQDSVGSYDDSTFDETYTPSRAY